jgi:hypothetical protein
MAFSLFLDGRTAFSLSLFFDAERLDQGKPTSMSLDISLSRMTDGDGVCEALIERSDGK